MATLTTRLGLRKPAPADLVDVTQDIDNPYDGIDAAVGFTVCTSTTRPVTPWSGQQIFETDTHNYLIWDGTHWLHLTVPTVSSTAQIINPWINQVVFTTATMELVRWTGTAWVSVYSSVSVNRANVIAALYGSGSAQYAFTSSSFPTSGTNTTYQNLTSSTGATFGWSFTAPASGKVKLHYGGNFRINSTTSTGFVGCVVATGSSIGTGAIVSDVTAGDFESIEVPPTNATTGSARFRIVSGLTPGNVYNAYLVWRSSNTSGTRDCLGPILMIDPVAV